MTRLRVVTVSRMRRLVSSCDPVDRLPARQLVIERVGVNGRDITLRDPNGGITACDRNPRANGHPFCGIAGWRLRRGRVSDPRLTICQDRQGRAVVAFGWINPVPEAAWVIVDQPGYREVYPVGGNLPVRVSTIAGLGSGKRVTFHVAQYDRRGALLVRKTVFAAIAS